MFGRSSDATCIDAAGAIEVLGANIARIGHDPSTLARIGMLVEAARTNLFLQSGAPATQTITVAAVPHSAALVGSGAFPARSELVFTPTAGALTATITGCIASPQLEEGGVASTYIPTLGSSTLRDNDVATVALGPWFDTTQGTVVFEGSMDSAAANDRIIEIDSGASSTRLSILWNTVLGLPQYQVWQAGALQAAIAPPGNSIDPATPFRVAITFKANDFAISLNGGALAKDTSGAMATGLSTMRLGRSVSGAQGLMLAESIAYYPTRLGDVEIQALSA